MDDEAKLSFLKMAEEEIYDNIASGEQGFLKKAAEGITRYTRLFMREDGIYRKIIPMEPVQNSDLAQVVETDLPSIVCELEPNSPAAMTIPFATTPPGQWLRGRKYLVTFARITTPTIAKDVDQLRTWIADLRQIVSDNMLRDMLGEEDASFLRACNSVMIAPNVVVPTSGVVQWRTYSSAITRDGIAEMFDILPSTPSSCEVQTVLLNNLTVNQLAKFQHNEIGGTLSERIFQKGWTQDELFGRKMIITIKKGLVGTRKFYLFGDPAFTGVSYSLEDAVMHVERKRYMISFDAYELIGGAIANSNMIGRADFEF